MVNREVRRSAGFIARANADLALHEVEDPRSERGRGWVLPALLRALFIGLMSGCASLAETERLTGALSPALRPKLGLHRRVPDTTLRGLVMKLPLDTVRRLMQRIVHIAHRRKALEPDGLPCGAVAIDGKHTATRFPDNQYAQRQKDGHIVRTMTCSLISARAAVCLDALPIPREQSESSAFPAVLAELVANYGQSNLFEIITADAGIGDAANARLVNEAGLGYVFALKEDQPTLHDEATRLLANLSEEACEHEDIDNEGQLTVVRKLWRTTEIAGFHGWDHLRMALRVSAERIDKHGQTVSTEDRYFVTNVLPNRLTAEQWVRLTRRHWRVENDVHQTLDVAFREDARPWLEAVHGMLVVQLLRRVALNLLLLYRNVTRRDEHKAAIPWSDLFFNLQLALFTAAENHLQGLRWAARGPSGHSPPTLP